MSESATIGHNSANYDLDAVDPLHLAPSAATVRDILALNYTDLIETHGERAAGLAAWVQEHTNPAGGLEITDEEDCMLTKDVLDQANGFLNKQIEATREAVKRTLLDAGKAVDEFFNDMLRDTLVEKIEPIQAAYLVALQTMTGDRQAELRETATKLRAEVGRLQEMAKKVKNAAPLKDRIEAAEAAALAAEALADGPIRELSKIRTDNNRVGGIKIVFNWRVEELFDLVMAVATGRQMLDGKPLIDMLMVNKVEANARIKRKDGLREVPGLHIYPEERPI